MTTRRTFLSMLGLAPALPSIVRALPPEPAPKPPAPDGLPPLLRELHDVIEDTRAEYGPDVTVFATALGVDAILRLLPAISDYEEPRWKRLSFFGARVRYAKPRDMGNGPPHFIVRPGILENF